MTDPDARMILQLIAEGYPVKTFDDRYIVIENPDFIEDRGDDPNLVFDVWSLYPEPAEERDAA